MKRAFRDSGLLGLLVVFVLPWYFYFGPRSPVIGKILVEGTEKIPPGEIIRRVAELKGKPFSGFSTKKAAREVLEDPRVEKVAVRFAFPNKLVVWVKEKKFDFILVSNQPGPGRLFGLSERLEIFPLDDWSEVGDRLVISGCGMFGGWFYRPVRTPAFGRLANFLAAVRRHYPEFLAQVSQLDFADPHNVKAYFLSSGAEINLGPPPYPPKLSLLKQMASSGFPPGNLDLRQKKSVYAVVAFPEEKR